MAKETVLYPGTYYTTDSPAGKNSLESRIRAVLRDCGYPCVNCNDAPCTQPDICDLISACPGSGTLTSLNGVQGDGTTGDEFRLGGSLDRVTAINTSTFDFSFYKDNVKLDINDAGGSLGAGEVARFLGTNGTITAEVGVYTTGGGAPQFGARWYNSGSDVYNTIQQSSALETLSLKAGLAANTDYFEVNIKKDAIFIGHADTVSTSLEIKAFSFTGGSYITLLRNLPVFADNSAAVAAGLPVDTLYKTSTGEPRIVV